MVERERDHLKDRRRWEDDINIAVQELGLGVIELIWLMLGTGGGHLSMR